MLTLFMWIQKGYQYVVCFIVSYKMLEKMMKNDFVEPFRWIHQKRLILQIMNC